jgi:Transmembrane domain of unknown function (DUF3566)
MNIALGLLIEVVAFGAAAYVVIALRPRLPQRTTDLLLASVGCVMGVGALLFQDDVAVSTGVIAPLLAGFLLVAHARVLDGAGVTLPGWVKIPALGHRGAYASAPTGTEEVEEPVQQPNATTEPEPATGFDPDPLPEEDDILAPPLPPAMPEPAWPSTVVRAPAQTRLPRRGARRTRVEVRRVGPFSVLKFSLIFYFCVFLVIYLALAIIWAILSASGVIESLEQLLGTIFPSGKGLSPTQQVSTGRPQPIAIDTGQVFTWLFFAGCVGVAVWSLINVFVAVMYNLISDIVGGVEVTLADRRD